VRGEGKIVSERALKLCRVSGGISPHIFNLDIKGNEWPEPPGRRWPPGKGPPVTHWERDWGGGGFAERFRTFWRRRKL
jgi:hypothetical protein